MNHARKTFLNIRKEGILKCFPDFRDLTPTLIFRACSLCSEEGAVFYIFSNGLLMISSLACIKEHSVNLRFLNHSTHEKRYLRC